MTAVRVCLGAHPNRQNIASPSLLKKSALTETVFTFNYQGLLVAVVVGPARALALQESRHHVDHPILEFGCGEYAPQSGKWQSLLFECTVAETK
jgi:hypothetical protein